MMDEMKQQIVDTGKWIMEKGLTWGTSGNISARKEDRIFVTASGTVMGDLKEEDIIVCDLEGKILEGEKKPSKEPECTWESTAGGRISRQWSTPHHSTLPSAPVWTWR